MHKLHHRGSLHSILSAFEGNNGYRYGWAVCENFLGYTLIQHGGGITGGISLIGFIKELKIGFAAIGNAAGFPMHQIYAALSILLDKDPDEEIPFFIRDSHFKSLCGDYSSYQGIHKVKVVNKLGVLYYESEEPPMSYPLFHSNDNNRTLEYFIQTHTHRCENACSI